MTRCALALLVLATGTPACTSGPAEIRIKGPRDAVESTQSVPTFAPFESKGDTLRLRASAFDARGRYLGAAVVDWQSSDRTKATVSQTGVVTALSSGKFAITATTKEEPHRTARLELEAKIVKGVRITKPNLPRGETLDMAMGESVQFSAEVVNDRGEVMPDARIRWRTTSYAATVSPTGEVQGRSIGSAQVVAEAQNGARARVDLEVGDWAKKKKRRRRRR